MPELLEKRSGSCSRMAAAFPDFDLPAELKNLAKPEIFMKLTVPLIIAGCQVRL